VFRDEVNASDCTYNVSIIRFAGIASTVRNSADYVVNSTRPDAVDHFISYTVGMMRGSGDFSGNIHIVSRDKFASCLSDFEERVHHDVSASDLINLYKS
jgi:hypothetical protein